MFLSYHTHTYPAFYPVPSFYESQIFICFPVIFPKGLCMSSPKLVNSTRTHNEALDRGALYCHLFILFSLYIIVTTHNPLSSVWISLLYKTRYISFNLLFVVAAAGEKKKSWSMFIFLWIAWCCATCHFNKCAFILEIPLQPHSHCLLYIFIIFLPSP